MHLFSKHFSLKRALSTFFVLLCLAFLIFSPQVIFNKENYSLNLNKYLAENDLEEVVLTIYHIETFEGGSASRAKYLEREGINFNKIHKNCYVTIKTLSPQSLALNLNSNNLPDMFSFGSGVGNVLAGFFSSLDKPSSIRQDLLSNCYYDGEILSYPYILSGYALISRSNNDGVETLSNLVSGGSYTNSLKTLETNSIKLDTSGFSMCDTQYKAYQKFIENKDLCLLGSARDVARCKNRERNGKIGALSYSYLGGYSDLVQYIGVTDNTDKIKMTYAKLFAYYLVSSSSQQNLSKYGLFSVNKQKIYQDGDYLSDFEDVLLEPLLSESAYISQEEVLKNREKTLQKICNN